jgi:predicted dehydrogenase
MSKVKILQVGCGGISHAWLDVWTQRTDVEIVGLVDIFEANAIGQRDKYKITCEVYTDLDTAIMHQKPDIVIDTTIPNVHHQVVTTALRHGCYVLGEKPLSDNIEHAIDMVRTADKMNKSYAVMQNYRNNPNVRAFRHIVEAGHIGQLGYLSANFFIGARFGGFRGAMDSPLILDMAIHTFDLARFISGCDPVSVYCHEFNPAGSWYQGASSACCIFEMTDGVVFSFNGSWSSISQKTSWSSEWRAQGSLGTSMWDGDHMPTYDIEKQGAEKTFHPDVERFTSEYIWAGQHGHAGGIDEMLTAIRENRRAETDCHDNIKSLGMVLAAIKSSREGRKVMLGEILSELV